MDVELRHVKIKELVEAYSDNGNNGVVAYRGRLEVRPPYQREFVYGDKKRNAVIDTIRQGFPLNILYWVDREKEIDGKRYEVLDGQQRIISICEFYKNNFSVKYPEKEKYFRGLEINEQDDFLEYPLMVYFCKGTGSEKIAWFRVINVAGEMLNDQEMLNAVYHGLWLTDAKIKFSKPNNDAEEYKDYLTGSAKRQDYLRTAIAWAGNGDIEEYMSLHHTEDHATKLWEHFESVMNWMKNIFPDYEKEMKGIDWGALYKKYKDANLDPKKLRKEINKLMADDDVTNKKGIYPFVLGEGEHHLNIRAFTDTQKKTKFKQQGEKCANDKCPNTDKKMTIADMEGDHITPWSEGGKTEPDNLQILCKECNRRKGAK